MKSARFFSLAFLILIFAFSTLLFAGVPKMINYQGKITDPMGALVDTTIPMIFTIYDAATDGGVLWTETQPSVVVEKGVFSVLLGSVVPIPDSVFRDAVRYLGVKVGADPEMTPRKAIVSVGYAFHSGTAQSAEHADTAQYAHTAPAMADADWVIDGDTIYHVPGNVGIGTTSPAQKLDVAGTTQMIGFKMPTGAGTGKVLTSDGSGMGSWQAAAGGMGGSGTINYIPKFLGSTTLGNSVIYETGGNVGIGTTSPSRKLGVAGHLALEGSAASISYALEFRDTGGSEWQVQYTGGGLHFWEIGLASRMLIKDGGNVGIGTTSPAQKLDVAGTTQMTGFKMPTGAGAGKVLTSDGGGVGTWQATPGGIGGSGTANYIPKFLGSTTLGNSVIYETGGNVGIGTTSPGAFKLNVNGGDLRVADGIDGTIVFGDNGYITYKSALNDGFTFQTNHWASQINFVTRNYSGVFKDTTVIDRDGNLGIGWTNPGDKLDVDGDIRVRGADIKDAGGTARITLTDNGRLDLKEDGGSASLSIATDGDVGIGTTAPDEELHVQGNIKMVDGNQAAGKVLTSDGSGVGSWQAAVAGGGGWADDGNTVRLETSTDSVGIGTTGPGYKLHVNGSFYSTTVNTGQGNNELFAMNQNVRTSDTPTFAGINTGPGNNELYAMNQNVRTTDNPTFNRVHLNDYGTALEGFHVGGTSDPGTDNLVVDRNVSIGNDLVVHGLAEIDQYLSHFQDPDTYILFTDDQLTLYSGSVNLIRAFEGTQDQVVINESSVDVDFRVESDLDVNAFFVRGSDGNVGIGTPNPGYDLHVNGSFYSNTVNTGQGSNELFAMNQNVRNNDNVTFNQVHLSDYGTALDGFHVGGTSDPGTDNLVVDGDVTVVGKLKVHNNNYGIGGVYCGVTASSYDGAGVGGYSGAKSKCESTCGHSWAHMCSAEEIVRSRQLAISIPTGWYSGGIAARTWGNRQLSDCRGWTATYDTVAGPRWDSGNNDPSTSACNQSLKILCCK